MSANSSPFSCRGTMTACTRVLRILVIEDTKQWREYLVAAVERAFAGFCNVVSAEAADNGTEAMRRLRNATIPFDLVLLDIVLGKREEDGFPHPNGFDILPEIAKNQSAFFVCILTGMLADPEMEALYGRQAALRMKIAGFCEAAKLFPPDRLRVFHKPEMDPNSSVEDIAKVFPPYLEMIHQHFAEADKKKNVFRKVYIASEDRKGPRRHIWEVRFNGGKTLLLMDKEGMDQFHTTLSLPYETFDINTLKPETLESEGRDSRTQSAPEGNHDGRQQSDLAERPEEFGPEEGFRVFEHTGSNDEGQLSDPDSYIETIGRLCEEAQKLASLGEEEKAESRAKELKDLLSSYASPTVLGIRGFGTLVRRATAAAHSGTSQVPRRLIRLALPPLVEAWQEIKSQSSSAPRGRIRVSKGRNTDAQERRKHAYGRVLEYFEAVGLSDLVEHLGRPGLNSGAMWRGNRLPGKISYRPSFYVEWLTDS